VSYNHFTIPSLILEEDFDFHTCKCPSCGKLINYFIFLSENNVSVSCDCGLEMTCGKDGEVNKKERYAETIYARGGKGNPKLIGWTATNNLENICYDIGTRLNSKNEMEIYKKNERQNFSTFGDIFAYAELLNLQTSSVCDSISKRVLTGKPRTVIGKGRFIIIKRGVTI
jgi:hypothetical protein